MPPLRLFSAALLLSALNGVSAESLIQKRCRPCPLDLPQCPVCPQGQTCTIYRQDCDTCPTVECVNEAAATGSDSVLPPGVSFSSFSLMPLPAGVTPTTVHNGPGESFTSLSTQPGGPVLPTTGNGSGSGASSTSVSAAATTTSTSASESESESGSSSATASAHSSVSSGLGGRNVELPWAAQAVLGAMGWALL